MIKRRPTWKFRRSPNSWREKMKLKRSKKSKTRKTRLQKRPRFKRKPIWTMLPSISRESGTGSKWRASSLLRKEKAKRVKEEKRRRSDAV